MYTGSTTDDGGTYNTDEVIHTATENVAEVKAGTSKVLPHTVCFCSSCMHPSQHDVHGCSPVSFTWWWSINDMQGSVVADNSANPIRTVLVLIAMEEEAAPFIKKHKLKRLHVFEPLPFEGLCGLLYLCIQCEPCLFAHVDF